MLPMRNVRLALGTLLAAQATTLAPATDANMMALIKSEFNPDEDLTMADIELADFDGSTPIAGATGAQQTGLDPVTGQQRITIKDPVGGYRWITTGLTNLNQAITGFCLVSNDLSTLIAIEAFPTPIVLNAVGQEINIGKATMNFVSQPIS